MYDLNTLSILKVFLTEWFTFFHSNTLTHSCAYTSVSNIITSRCSSKKQTNCSNRNDEPL